MLVRWLFTVFPREMAHAWRLLQPDVVFWFALAGSLATLGHTGASLPAGPAALILNRFVLFVVVLLLAAARFDAASNARREPWAVQLAGVARKFPFTAFSLFLAGTVSVAFAVALGTAAVLLFQGTEAAILGPRAVGRIAFVVLFVRFAFVPYVVALAGPGLLPAGPRYASTIGRRIFRAIWPLVISNRLTETRRWRIAPYLLLAIYAPQGAGLAQGVARPALSFALHLVSFTALAALFDHYSERVRSALAASSSP